MVRVAIVMAALAIMGGSVLGEVSTSTTTTAEPAFGGEVELARTGSGRGESAFPAVTVAGICVAVVGALILVAGVLVARRRRRPTPSAQLLSSVVTDPDAEFVTESDV